MARLFTAGAERQQAKDEGWTLNGTSGINTSTPRSGLAAYSFAAGSVWLSKAVAATVSTAYFARCYINPSGNPTNAERFLAFTQSTTTQVGEARLETSGKVSLCLNNGTAIVTTASAIPANQWTRVELQVNYPASGAATITLVVNGTVIGSGTGSATLPTGFRIGTQDTGPGVTVLIDDVALNDSTGASQNSYPGEGRIRVLLPVADNARTGWTGGAGGTTNLWDALNNVPPTGVASASATDASQIKDANNNATDTYQAAVQAPNTAYPNGASGIQAADTITLALAVAVGGQSSATSRTLAVSGISNPAITEGTAAGPTAAVGADPTGWLPVSSAVAYNPTMDVTVQPVVQVRKGVATTDTQFYESLGLQVEYVKAPIVISSGFQLGTTSGMGFLGQVAESDSIGLTATGRKTAQASISTSTRFTPTVTGSKVAQGQPSAHIGFGMALVTPILISGTAQDSWGFKLAVQASKLIRQAITITAPLGTTSTGEKIAVASRWAGTNLSPSLNLSPDLNLSHYALGVADTFGFRLQPTGAKAIGDSIAITAHVVFTANGIAGLQFPAGLELKVFGAKQASGHAAAILTALQPSLASQKRVTSPVLISYGLRQTLAALTHRSGHPALIEIPLDAYPLAGILTPVIMTLDEFANEIAIDELADEVAIDETELTLLRIEVE